MLIQNMLLKGIIRFLFCFFICCFFTIDLKAVITSDTVKLSTCRNENVTLSPGGGLSYLWQNGSTASAIDIFADGNKTVSVTVVHKIDTSKIIFVIIPVSCNINAGSDIAICKGSTAKLTAITNGQFKEWTPITTVTSPKTVSTNVNPTITTSYVATAIFPAQNLIINGDFEKGFENFTSDYIYGDSVLKYGYYVIGKNPYSYGPSWARNFTDHTTGTGRMMIVDGSETVGQDVYRTTVFVHKGDDYVFSTWIKNVKEGLDNPAKLRFYINDQAFGSINLPVGETNWVYFNTFWTAPSDTTITISIKNQNTSGIGNDFAFDDMVFSDYVTLTDTVVVTVNPIPVVVASTSKSSICVGESVTLNGNNATTYVWNNSVVNNVALKPTTTKTYIVTGTDNNGCVNTSTVSVIVNPLPTIKATANPTSICTGESSILTASGGISYIWSNAIVNGGSISPTSTQTYSVSGTDSKGCSNTANVSIIVNPLPTITANSSTICFGKSTILNATGANSYIWDGGIINNTVFSPTATKTYNVTGTDSKGCKSTSTATVTVNSLPVISIIAGPTALCIGQSTKLSGQGAQSYIWDNAVIDNSSFAPTTTKTYTVTGTDANGCKNKTSSTVIVYALPTITTFSQTICIGQTTKLQGSGALTYNWDSGIFNNSVFSPTGTTIYNVTGTDVNGCQNIASAKVTVNPVPTITATSQVICLGKSVKLNGNGATSYVWSGGIIDNTLFNPTATTTYNVTGTDTKGCSNTSSALVTINSLPTITVSSQAICSGQATKLLGTGAISYVWNKGIWDNIPFTPIVSDTYFVTGTDGNGCKNNSSATVSLYPLPTITAVSQTICYGQSTTLNGQGALSYVWDGGITNNTLFTPKGSSVFTVIGTDANGCKNSGTATVFVNPLPVLTYNAIPQICEYANPVTIDYAKPSGGVYSGIGVSGVMFSPKVSGSGIHPITYVYNDANGCSNVINQIVTVNAKPVLTFNLDAQRCYDAGFLQLSASPSGGVFSGIGVVGQSFNPTIPTSEISNPISYGYSDPITGCADTITKSIIVHYTPPPVVHNVQTSTIALQTSILATGNGTMHWYDDANLSTQLYVGNPYFHGYTNTIYRNYYITQVINGCESISDTMILKIVSCGTPAPLVNNPTLKCLYQALDTVKVTNTIIDSKVARVIWRDVNDIIVSRAKAFAPTFTAEGSVTYQVALDTSGCEGAGVNVTWSRYKTPIPIVDPVPSPCHGFAIPSFTATNVYGTVKWYNTATLDTLVGTGNTFKTKDPNSVLQYYWVTNNDMCISDPVRVQLVIYPKPAPPSGYLLYESCQGSPIQAMSVTPSIGTTWYDSKNQILGTDISSYTPPLSILKLDQKLSYSTIYFDGHCYSDPFAFDYLLKRKPLKPILHPDTICLGSKRVSLEVGSGNNVTWKFPALNKQYTGLKIKPDITTVGTFKYNVWDELNGCLSDVAYDSVITGPTPQNGVLGPKKICENTTKQAYSVTSKNPKSSYSWAVTGNRPSYRANAKVEYYQNFDFLEQGIDTIYVTETNEFGCSGTDSAVIRIAPTPAPDFVYDVPSENYKYQFTNVTDSLYITDGKYKELLPLAFKWNFGRETDMLISQSWNQYLKDTVYNVNYPFGAYDVLLMASPLGYVCADTISKPIYIDIREALFVPTAFSPDHSSPNLSVFTAKGFNLKSYKMWIYDFWGNLLFYTDKLYNGQPLEGWDGTYNGVIQKVDSYVWKVEAEFLDGVLWKGQSGAKTQGKTTFGNVLLFR
jgi:hypothetical protein